MGDEKGQPDEWLDKVLRRGQDLQQILPLGRMPNENPVRLILNDVNRAKIAIDTARSLVPHSTIEGPLEHSTIVSKLMEPATSPFGAPPFSPRRIPRIASRAYQELVGGPLDTSLLDPRIQREVADLLLTTTRGPGRPSRSLPKELLDIGKIIGAREPKDLSVLGTLLGTAGGKFGGSAAAQ